MASFVNNAVFVATSGGTGAFSVSAAATGYQTPAAAGASDTKTYRYRAYSSDLTQWEIGSTVPSSSATSFTRVVTASSAGGTTTVNFTNPPTVALSTVFAADLLQFDDAMSLTSAQKAQGRANLDVLKNNYIVNGAMMVSQENGTTAGTANAYYPVDQFRSVISGTTGVASFQQVASATPGGSPNRLRVTVTTADASVAAGDYLALYQKIEGSRVADLRFGSASAKQITIQFGVKAPAGTYCVVLQNGASNRSYVSEYVVSGGEANTDVVKSVTFSGDTSGTWATDTATGFYVVWGLMAGSTFQQAANSWGTGNVLGSANQFNLMGTINNVFELFDVGLYEGGVAPAFMMPDFVSELVACQRYWEKSYVYATAPGTATATGCADLIVGTASAGSLGISVQFKVTKRAAATIITYDLVGASSKVYRGGNGVTPTSAAGADQGFLVYSASGTSANELAFQWTANARL